MQQNYVCLDRRYATSEVVQGTQQLPYGPYSYWLDHTKYAGARIYFINFVTDDPSDADVCNSLMEIHCISTGYPFECPLDIHLNIHWISI
jgi:hypothetical protein